MCLNFVVKFRSLLSVNILVSSFFQGKRRVLTFLLCECSQKSIVDWLSIKIVMFGQLEANYIAYWRACISVSVEDVHSSAVWENSKVRSFVFRIKEKPPFASFFSKDPSV